MIIPVLDKRVFEFSFLGNTGTQDVVLQAAVDVSSFYYVRLLVRVHAISATSGNFAFKLLHTLEGVAERATLILPAEFVVPPDAGLVTVGELRRTEAAELIVGYAFDLDSSELVPQKAPNPYAGREHVFRAYRVSGSPGVQEHVSMRIAEPATRELDGSSEEP